MSTSYPVLPIAGSVLVRVVASLAAIMAYAFKAFASARRNRHEAAQLAGLDHRMLADIGLTRSDVADAFSEPFWEDPTALLRERAIERRMNRPTVRKSTAVPLEPGFQRPRMDRPARHAI